VTPLSACLGQPAPQPVPTPDFPPYIPEKAASIDFISYFNFLLGQLKPGPYERPLLDRWAAIGGAPGGPFDADSLTPEVREGIAHRVHSAPRNE
jgi:hypothetical protein